MKILLDTSYFLPLIKIAIEDISDTFLLDLMDQSQYELYYTDISIFELTAKGLKYATQTEQITIKDVINGIDTMQNNSRIQMLSWSDNPIVIELASKFKMINSDTIDCLIFATGICKCDSILTMDETFWKSISKDENISNDIRAINENFQLWVEDLSKAPRILK